MNELTLKEKPFGDIEKLSTPELRDFISEIERIALEQGEPVDVPINHHFSKSVYAREMKMPKGAMIVGKIHKYQNLNILSEGEVSVLSVDGVMRVKAPFTLVASPGAKRVIYAHSDVTWTTIHGTDETDLEKIENEFIAKTYDEVVWLDGQEFKKVGGT